MIPTPAQLLADIPDFVGRNQLMCRLAMLLERPEGPNLCSLHGLDGMGKTTLAVHVAHTLRDRYPDGQLFADLRGASAQLIDPAELLGRFLRSIGYPGELPRDLEERAALWRSYVNGRSLFDSPRRCGRPQPRASPAAGHRRRRADADRRTVAEPGGETLVDPAGGELPARARVPCALQILQ
jgi:hypothetical protein